VPEPDRLLLWLATATYSASVLYAVFRLARHRRHSHSVTYPLIAVGFILQTAGLYLRGMEIGGCPLGNTFEIIQFVLWSTIFLFLVVGPVFRVNLLGTASAALVSFGSLLSLLLPQWDQPHTRKIFGGDPLIGTKGQFVGMDSFGASAPYKTLYQHFGITAQAVADAARSLLGSA